MAQGRAAALVAEQHKVILVKGAAHGPEVRQLSLIHIYVMSLSLRVSFAEVARPLLADGRFWQPHRSYVVNRAAARLLTAGELQMSSGARIPIPRCLLYTSRCV